MPGNLTFDELKTAVADQSIDTVVAALIDMQGRLMGKRFYAQNFIDHAWQETHCCNYLLATDLEMATPEGYESTSWSSGYGDYVMKPDMSTLRRVPWSEGTVLVLCDVLDHHTHKEIPHSPRAMLKKQIERLKELGFTASSATELEFFVYLESYEQARTQHYQNLTPISPYNEDYHLFQTFKEEGLMRDIRNKLAGAGIPVENTKGEAEAGQAELNIRYADSLDMADNHSIAKNGVKEIAYHHGKSVTFLAKCHEDTVGSSSHVHQSLWTLDGKSAFYDSNNKHGMSQTMQHYLAGQLAYASDITYFLAPYVNSYKRFVAGTFAPTKIIWSVDNRTAGYRVVGANSSAVRFECRIGGVDLNPYLALSAIIAAGIAGLEQKLSLPEEYSGDAYAAQDATNIPNTLLDAADTLRQSDMLRDAFGEDVVKHYTRAAECEIEDFNRVVTDYEFRRGFERA